MLTQCTNCVVSVRVGAMSVDSALKYIHICFVAGGV